ncbi:MAG TPA: lipoyl(octanoyl) transferase LipB [Actinomycetota bacterium]|nr:lipoyl(octanoyl) transferase LipB [Actinomycetota bacterium]
MTATLAAAWLGLVEYPHAWDLQRRIFGERADGSRGDCLILLEHPHTYTLGKRAVTDDVLYDAAERAERGISLYNVDRGGRATYHGPGQLVGYPIMHLGDEGRYDVIAYLRALEEALILTLGDLGVVSGRDEEHTGVWVGPNKIGAIGVKISRGVTMHGFALNITTNLDMFGGIVPCGIQGRGVTSVERETGERHPLREVATIAAHHVGAVFGRSLEWADPDDLFGTARGQSAASPEPVRVHG